ncbi:MAG: hypothetical protein RLZZ374_1423 [Cyanobacteriota bacterium]
MLGADSMEIPMDPGCSRAFAGRRVAITGASGSLGVELLRCFHGYGASLVALTTRAEPLELATSDGAPIPLEQVRWSSGHESELSELFSRIDILVVNHGINVHGDRSAGALEVWINTSEAEILPAVSPVYEISKRLVGQLVSLRSLDLAGPELRIRRLVLGPFRSNLNPIGLLGAGFVAQAVLRLAAWDWGLIIVTPNPLTYVIFPLAVLLRWTYLGLFSRPSAQAPDPAA